MFQTPISGSKGSVARYASFTPLSFGATKQPSANVVVAHDSSAISNILSLADEGTSMWPVEARFHEVMRAAVASNGIAQSAEGSVYCIEPCTDISAHADLASVLAEECDRRAVDAYEEAQRQANLGTRRGMDSSAVLQAEAEESRVERDLWCLLDVLARADLLHDLEELDCGLALSSALEAVDPSLSLREVVDLSLRTDDTLKKLRVLQDWLERATTENVTDLPPANELAWGATLDRIRSGHRTLVKQLHPDAQLSSGGDFLPLEGTDVTDQESSMKLIWQCIRSGQIARAQLAAKDQGMFWLAASLMGVADEFHELNSLLPTEGQRNREARVVAVRHGNTKKSIWMNTCFDHSQRVFASYERRSSAKGNQQSVTDTRDDRGMNAAVLEASIFGCLSNNVSVMARSPLLASWPDLLWVAVKSQHDRRLYQILHNHRTRRAAMSGLYPGCGPDELAAGEKYIERLSRAPDNTALPAQGSTASTLYNASFCGTVEEMLHHLRPRCSKDNDPTCVDTGSSFTLVCLWRLQSAIIGGLSSLRTHIDDMMDYFEAHRVDADIERKPIHSARSFGRYSGHNRLLRVYAHLYAWLKTAPASQPQVQGLVSGDRDGFLHAAVRNYIEMLVSYKRRNLVALYCVFLPRDQRIETYVRMMQSLPASTRRIGESGSTVLSDAPAMEATQVLNSASVYFRADLADITRAVVDTARVCGVEGQPSDDTPAGRRRMASEYDAEDAADSRSTMATANRIVGAEISDALRSSPRSKRVRYETETGTSAHLDPVVGAHVSFSRAAMSDAAVSVDDGDVGRMDTLRWLCIDVQDRPEAVRQTNAFIRQLLLESKGEKTNELRLLLRKILPSDTLEVAKDIYGRAVAAKTSTDDLSWGAEYSQLKFWYLVCDAFSCIEAWENVHQEFLGSKGSLIGGTSVLLSSLSRFKPKILAESEKAIVAISTAVHCEADSYEELFDQVGGVRGVWMASEKALVQQLCDILEDVAAAVEAEAVDPTDELTTVLEYAFVLFCPDGVQSDDSNSILRSIKVGLSERLEVMVVLDVANRIKESFVRGGEELVKEGMSSELSLMVEAALRILQDIDERRQVVAIMTGHLLRQWAKILLATASVLKTLKDEKGYLQCHRAVIELATEVANENPGLQIYKLISMDTLRCLLENIAAASIVVHELKGSFSVGNMAD